MTGKHTLAAALAACLFLSVVAFAEEAGGRRFLSGIQDVPLMPGLAEDGEAGLMFDTPGGRIVEAYAGGPVRATEIAAFYLQTLPQLGWTAAPVEDTTLRFAREGETLTLEFSAAASTVTVRYTLTPE